MLLNHVAICTDDPEALRAFYENVFGMRVVRNRNAGQIYWMAAAAASPWKIVIMKGIPRPQNDSFDHFGIEVESEQAVRRICDRAANSGAVFVDCRRGDKEVGFHCIVRDPVGNFVEVNHYENHSDD